MSKIHYCLGLVFSEDLKSILLIEKLKPDKLAGYLNGIGGKVEFGELYIEAMVRECKEEIDLDIPKEKWINICQILDKSETFSMLVYATTADVFDARQMEEEIIYVAATDDIINQKTLGNIQWMVPYAKRILMGESDVVNFASYRNEGKEYPK